MVYSPLVPKFLFQANTNLVIFGKKLLNTYFLNGCVEVAS